MGHFQNSRTEIVLLPKNPCSLPVGQFCRVSFGEYFGWMEKIEGLGQRTLNKKHQARSKY
jgi:hypothetical protein